MSCLKKRGNSCILFLNVSWWNKPLEHFKERTFMQSRGGIVRSPSASVIDLSLRADSVFEGFPSMRTNVLIDKIVKEEEDIITMDIQEDDDKGLVSTKLLSYHKEPIDGRNYSESIDFFDTSPRHIPSSPIITKEHALQEFKFIDEFKLSNFENKFKKRYNAVLTLDEKDEDDDELRNKQKMRDKMNRRKKSIDNTDPVMKFAFLDHEEAELYTNYCNMQELDADDIVSQEEIIQMRRDIQDKLDVGHSF
jgi:hypothetical protein